MQVTACGFESRSRHHLRDPHRDWEVGEAAQQLLPWNHLPGRSVSSPDSSRSERPRSTREGAGALWMSPPADQAWTEGADGASQTMLGSVGE